MCVEVVARGSSKNLPIVTRTVVVVVVVGFGVAAAVFVVFPFWPSSLL